MNIEKFLELLSVRTGHQSKKSGKDYIARCPAHDDQNPSLSISESNEGDVLLHCHAGCDNNAICSELGISLSDLFMKNGKSPTQIKTEYIYLDDSGKPAYKKVRLEPGNQGKSKSFFISSLDANGSWINKTPNASKRFLYRLDEVKTGIKQGKKIYLVEGEKDVERLGKEKLISTTILEGAGGTIRSDYVKQLEGADIVLLYDEDKAGYVRRDKFCVALLGKVQSLRVVKLPGLAYREDHGLDVSDWLDRGHTIQELEQYQGIPDLATKEGQDIVESVLGDAELLILDNLSCLVRRTLENESDSWLPIQEWLLKLRRKGVSVLFIHHAGKSGIQRGKSRREDVLDSVIALRHPPSYRHEEGAKFEVKNEKPRGITGKDVEPFTAKLLITPENGVQWEIVDEKDVDFDGLYNQVVALSNEGNSLRKIADSLSIKKNRVEAIIKKARENGDLLFEG